MSKDRLSTIRQLEFLEHSIASTNMNESKPSAD